MTWYLSAFWSKREFCTCQTPLLAIFKCERVMTDINIKITHFSSYKIKERWLLWCSFHVFSTFSFLCMFSLQKLSFLVSSETVFVIACTTNLFLLFLDLKGNDVIFVFWPKKIFPCFIFDLCVYSGREKINRSIFVQKGITDGDKTKEKHEIPFRQRKAIFVLLLFSFFILIIIRLHIFLCFFVQGYVTTIFFINLYLRFLTFKKI